MKAMILAAGMGTRLLPLTENKPKVLIEVQGVTLLEHTICYLKHFGIREIVINVHHHAGQIVDFLKRNNNFNIRIEISDESDELLDTGGGLYKARRFFNDNEPFVLTASDVITSLNLYDMQRFHLEHKPLASLAVKHRKSTREFLFDTNMRLSGWQNNITGEIRQVRQVLVKSKIAFSTIHIIDPAIFNLISERGTFSMKDVYLRLASENCIMGFQHDNSAWFECGRIENLESLNQEREIEAIFAQFH
jgi:NDP-sugar pyrophosphorylase family protein